MTGRFGQALGRLAPRDRKALALGLVVCLLALGYLALADPIVSRYEAVENQRRDLERQRDRDKSAARFLWKREAKLAGQLAQFDLYSRSLNILDSGFLDQARFMEEIEDNAQLMGVSIEQLRPLGRVEQAGRVASPVEVAFHGSLADIQKFIYFLETSAEVFVVSDLSIKAREGTGDFQGKVSLTKHSLPREGEAARTGGPGDTLVLGLYRRAGNGPFYIAEAKGWLASPTGRVALRDLDHYKSVEMLLGSGDLRAINTSFMSLSYLRVVGLDFRAVMVTDFSSNQMGLVVSPSSTIRSVKDLPGKTVFIQAAQFSHFGFSALLTRHGVTISELKAENMAPSMVQRSMEAGLIEAAFVEEPYLDLLASRGMRVIETYRSEGEGLPRVVAVGRELLSGRGLEPIQTLARAYRRGLDWWRANKAEGDRIVADRLKMSPDQLGLALASITFPSDDRLRAFACGQGKDNVQAYVRMMEEFYGGYVGRELRIPVEEVVDAKLLREQAGCDK